MTVSKTGGDPLSKQGGDPWGRSAVSVFCNQPGNLPERNRALPVGMVTVTSTTPMDLAAGEVAMIDVALLR
jgi:hypothetical protein